MRKPAFCTCENKDADQLRGNREAYQCLCFRHTDCKIPFPPNSTGVNQKVLPVLSTETLLHIWLSTEYYGFRPSSTAVDTVS